MSVAWRRIHTAQQTVCMLSNNGK